MHHLSDSLSRLVLASTAAVALGVSASAQATVVIGGSGAHGCQTNATPPVLTGGVPASAQLDFAYDRTTHVLKLTVTNTSPVRAGESNPLLAELYFNLPEGAVTGIALVGQSGSGGGAPSFALSRDVKAACFGIFDVCLAGRRTPIANASAPRIGNLGTPVTGPVEFRFELSGPGVDTIDAANIAFGFSTNPPAYTANAAAKYQAAGVGAEESGYLGAVEDCVPTVHVNGTPRIGGRIEFCITGRAGCHNCLWASFVPGPVQVGQFTLPVGLPLIFNADAGQFPATGSLCFPVVIPNDPRLSGRTIYFVVLTFPPGQPSSPSFGSVYELKIQ
jgi:hypothetical protein